MRSIPRAREIQNIHRLLKDFGAVGILGPRQTGKTTLAKQLKPGHFFDLESAADFARLENPELALGDLRGLVVIDEIQRRPELFPTLRYLIDQEPKRRKFLILGSASPELLRQSSESLAGRISYIELEGFRPEETPARFRPKLWLRGGYPRSLLAATDLASLQWRESYIRDFLERDIPALGITVGAPTLSRFWSMLAHAHGGILNMAELGASFGVSETAIRHYLEILEGTFMISLLKPWSENISKRQVKRPKVYLKDTGLLHALLGLKTQKDLEGHPKSGFSWEGFAIQTVMRKLRSPGRQFYFWSTHSGAELDLLMTEGARKIGFEAKFGDAPRLTESMKSSIATLGLKSLHVLYPGSKEYRLSKNVTVTPLSRFQFR